MSDTPRIASTQALADHLGLSRWTVSRALNGHPDIKESTRKRVLDAMASEGFAPDPLARGLRGGSTGMIGVCFQELENPLLMQKVASLQSRLRTAGYQPNTQHTSNDPETETAVIRRFISMRAEAVILFSTELKSEDPAIQSLIDSKITTICIDPVHTLPFPTIRVARAHAYPQAMRHLYDQGHRKFALLGLEEGVIYGKDRMAGIYDCLEELGLDKEECLSPYVGPGRERLDFHYGYDLASMALKAGEDATAWIGLNDRIAIGAARRISEAGLKIPQDIALAGFDNNEASAFLTPTLTSVDQCVGEQMDSVMELLSEAKNSSTALDPKILKVIEPKLIIRESTQFTPNENS
ncbi:MAG: LacI family DNA-binding transcriptional regulator [Opitutales bacterium]